MKFRKNLSKFIAKQGLTYMAFAVDRGISPSQLSQILHGTYTGTFAFWASIAVDYNLTVSQMIDLYNVSEDPDNEEVAAWLNE